MTVLVGQGRLCPPAPFSRHSRSSCGTQTPSFQKLSEPKPSFPECEPKLRHSAHSRGIHLCLPTHQPEKPVPSALQYGYCDFAQYDGVGRARASLSSGTLLPSFPKYPPNPNTVIPGVAAEPKHRHSRSSCGTQTPSFPDYLSNPNAVILVVTAASKLRHSARSRGIHLCLPTHQAEKPVPSALQYGYCDFAQYDGVGRARASLSSGTLLPSFPE